MADSKTNDIGPRLIVNADDFGISPAVNTEILRCINEGIITSVSLIAPGCAAGQAIEIARNFNEKTGLGIHLALDDSVRPITDPKTISSIVTKNGRFFSRSQLIKKLISHRINPGDIHRELSAQIEKVISAGIKPDHLDGHGHIHVFPSLVKIVIELAQHYAIPSVRLPAEPLTAGRPYRRLSGRLALRSASLLAKKKFKGNLEHPDFMLGFSAGGCYKEHIFLRDLSRLKNGQIAEAMFHPGPENIDIPQFNNWGYKWAIDSATLRSKKVKDQIKQQNIKLITFTPDFPSKSLQRSKIFVV